MNRVKQVKEERPTLRAAPPPETSAQTRPPLQDRSEETTSPRPQPEFGTSGLGSSR